MANIIHFILTKIFKLSVIELTTSDGKKIYAYWSNPTNHFNEDIK